MANTIDNVLRLLRIISALLRYLMLFRSVAGDTMLEACDGHGPRR